MPRLVRRAKDSCWGDVFLSVTCFLFCLWRFNPKCGSAEVVVAFISKHFLHSSNVKSLTYILLITFLIIDLYYLGKMMFCTLPGKEISLKIKVQKTIVLCFSDRFLVGDAARFTRSTWSESSRK